jgi:uncharacterized protein
MVKRVLFAHGWDGVPDDAWKPWLKGELEKKGWEWVAPQLPGGEYPVCVEWVMALQHALPVPDKHTFLVGHSLGCAALLRYVESLPSDTHIGGVVLIAGFCSPLADAPEINSFTTVPFAWETIMQRVKKIIVIGSRDDDVVPLGKILELQAVLRAELMIDEGKGHFSADDDITELPSVLKALEKCYQQRF